MNNLTRRAAPEHRSEPRKILDSPQSAIESLRIDFQVRRADLAY